MSQPTDPPASRSIELSVEVPGTPEEVWDAIATGPGITSWWTPFEVEGREGGRVTMDFGSFGTEDAVVTAYEAPLRFAYHGPEEGSLAFEWLVEARDGGSCVVRLVNSGFGFGEDWDTQFDGMTEGWQIFLQALRLHLTHFRGQPATRAFVPTVTLPGPNRPAWERFCRELGVSPDLASGDDLRTGDGVPALAGRVESRLETATTTTYLLVLDEPAEGTGFISVEGDAGQVAGSVYLYLHGDDTSGGDAWVRWLQDRFPAMTEVQPQKA